MQSHENLLKLLQDRGLSEKKSHIYLCLLEFGQLQASTIGRKTKYKRATVYALLQELVHDGIAHKRDKEDVVIYTVIEPKDLLARKKTSFEQFEKVFTEHMPQFNALNDKYGNKPQISYFEGKEGLKRFYGELLHSQTPLRSFLGSYTVEEDLGIWLNRAFLPERIGKKLHAKVIMCPTEANKHAYDAHPEKDNNHPYTEVKIIDQTGFSLYNQIDMFDTNKVSLVSYAPESMYAIVMENKFFHDSLANIFDLLWQTN